MFTGIIEEVGEVVDLQVQGDSAVLTVRAATVIDGITHGASIAVSGVCLTVVGRADQGSAHVISFDVMGETLTRSVIGNLAAGDHVNLERAARVDSRLDGHVVQGHVDGTGVVLDRTPCSGGTPASEGVTGGGNWESVRFGLPATLARFVAEKGSIAIDGVSLTVTAVGPDWFEVGLIPETLRATTLGGKQSGNRVNLEVDVLAKYVARLMETAS
ncbi:MAG: riboflavin synthase [Jatrophihabitantaceae bacterium]